MILLIEDNEDDVYAMQWACRKAQITEPIEVLNDGLKARNYLAGIGTVHERPLVIFMDLKLPFYNGHEILEWMQSQPALGDIPVVVLSGSDEGRDHTRADEKGALTYLVKPPTPEDLVKVLQSMRSGRFKSAVV